MKIRFCSCVLLVSILTVCMLGVPVYAAEEPTVYATDSFHVVVPAHSAVKAETSFPMKKGELVSIVAQYDPFFESCKVGVVDENNVYRFHYVNDGSVDVTMEIKESGNYTLRFVNDSDSEINITGVINY